eukprot:gene12547-biopygen4780
MCLAMLTGPPDPLPAQLAALAATGGWRPAGGPLAARGGLLAARGDLPVASGGLPGDRAAWLSGRVLLGDLKATLLASRRRPAGGPQNARVGAWLCCRPCLGSPPQCLCAALDCQAPQRPGLPESNDSNALHLISAGPRYCVRAFRHWIRRRAVMVAATRMIKETEYVPVRNGESPLKPIAFVVIVEYIKPFTVFLAIAYESGGVAFVATMLAPAQGHALTASQGENPLLTMRRLGEGRARGSVHGTDTGWAVGAVRSRCCTREAALHRHYTIRKGRVLAATGRMGMRRELTPTLKHLATENWEPVVCDLI